MSRVWEYRLAFVNLWSLTAVALLLTWLFAPSWLGSWWFWVPWTVYATLTTTGLVLLWVTRRWNLISAP